MSSRGGDGAWTQWSFDHTVGERRRETAWTRGRLASCGSLRTPDEIVHSPASGSVGDMPVGRVRACWSGMQRTRPGAVSRSARPVPAPVARMVAVGVGERRCSRLGAPARRPPPCGGVIESAGGGRGGDTLGGGARRVGLCLPSAAVVGPGACARRGDLRHRRRSRTAEVERAWHRPSTRCRWKPGHGTATRYMAPRGRTMTASLAFDRARRRLDDPPDADRVRGRDARTVRRRKSTVTGCDPTRPRPDPSPARSASGCGDLREPGTAPPCSPPATTRR